MINSLARLFLLFCLFRCNHSFTLSFISFSVHLCLFSSEFLCLVIFTSIVWHFITHHLCKELLTGLLTTDLHHLSIHIQQVLLLWAKNRTRSSNSNPTNKCCWWETKVLHAVESYQWSSSSQTCFAVNGDSGFFWFCVLQELLYNLIGWRCSIEEIQI